MLISNQFAHLCANFVSNENPLLYFTPSLLLNREGSIFNNLTFACQAIQGSTINHLPWADPQRQDRQLYDSSIRPTVILPEYFANSNRRFILIRFNNLRFLFFSEVEIWYCLWTVKVFNMWIILTRSGYWSVWSRKYWIYDSYLGLVHLCRKLNYVLHNVFIRRCKLEILLYHENELTNVKL